MLDLILDNWRIWYEKVWADVYFVPSDTKVLEIYVTPSVLRPKQITKPYREHHVYVIIHVMEGVDNIFMTLDDQ